MEEKKNNSEKKEGGGGGGGGVGGESSEGDEKTEEIANPDTMQRRVLRRDSHSCTWSVLGNFAMFLIFFLTPVLLGTIAYGTAPSDFFTSSMTSDAARSLLLSFACGPPYLYVLVSGLSWTLVKRMPMITNISKKVFQEYYTTKHNSTIYSVDEEDKEWYDLIISLYISQYIYLLVHLVLLHTDFY